MKELLNPAQKNALQITLTQFEENLLHAQAWLDGSEEKGVLHQRKLILSENARQLAEQAIKEARELIKRVSHEFDLSDESENAAASIRGKMSISWADLMDSRAEKLKRCGQVHPGLSGVLDPSIEHMAEIALRLTTIFRG